MVYSPWFIGTRLRDSQWLRWPSHEVESVQRWLDAWLDAILRYWMKPGEWESRWFEIPDSRRIESWLTLAEEANLDTNPLVDRIARKR